MAHKKQHRDYSVFETGISHGLYARKYIRKILAIVHLVYVLIMEVIWIKQCAGRLEMEYFFSSNPMTLILKTF